jgi:hypothetical protein
MSHREDCPDEWEARAAGRRDAQECGYSRSSRFEECEDAQSAYRRGFYAEQERQQEEQWLLEQQQRAEEERAQEEAYWEAMAAEEAASLDAEQPGIFAPSGEKEPSISATNEPAVVADGGRDE